MAKKLSLIAKGIAIIFVIVGMLFFDLEAGDALMVGAFIAGAFLPVDASLIVKNIKRT